jgi:hypothetical protein
LAVILLALAVATGPNGESGAEKKLDKLFTGDGVIWNKTNRTFEVIWDVDAALGGAFETFRTFNLFLDSTRRDYSVYLSGTITAYGFSRFAYEKQLSGP